MNDETVGRYVFDPGTLSIKRSYGQVDISTFRTILPINIHQTRDPAIP